MSKMKWSYGITSVPSRVSDYLPSTIKSLAAAGFEEPLLFMDGAADTSEVKGLAGLTIRVPAVGHLGNWYSALLGIYFARPNAQRFAIFEDDLLACRNLREYLDRSPYPERGYLNLLTHDCNLVLSGPSHGWFPSNQRGQGAVGLVFDREAIWALLNAKDFAQRPASGRLKAADGVVCDSLIPQGFREYCHNPSLLQHIGVESAMGHKYGTVMAFEGTEYDPLELLDRDKPKRTWSNAT